jgi:hypothetical protein
MVWPVLHFMTSASEHDCTSVSPARQAVSMSLHRQRKGSELLAKQQTPFGGFEHSVTRVPVESGATTPQLQSRVLFWRLMQAMR